MDGVKRIAGMVLGAVAVVTGLRRLLVPARTPPPQAMPSAPPPAAAGGATASRSQPPVVARRDVGAVARGVAARIKRDRLSLVSGSLAYKGILSLVPALIATVSIYGLVLSPEDVLGQIDRIASSLPSAASEIVTDQLNEIVSGPASGLGLGAFIGIAVALWSASSAASTLIQAINLAYETTDDRPFLERRVLGVGFTVGFLLIGGLSLAALAVLPVVLRDAGLGGAGRFVLEYGRIPVVAVALLVGLALAYRYAPNRTGARIKWLSWGAVIATVAFLAVTAGFGFYAANLGRFNSTYGTLGAVVVLLLWLYLSGFVVVAGAEVNAELELGGGARGRE